MNIIIIANGLFPTVPPVLSLLSGVDKVICCDGALAKYLRWYRTQMPRPHHEVVVIGDGDSLSPSLLREAQHESLELTHIQVDEQEFNDLSKAVFYAMESLAGEEYAKVTILGATGLREDHTLGNIGLLAYYQQRFPNATFEMPSDYGSFYTVNGIRTMASYAGQQVSIFSMQAGFPITVSGLRYPIEVRAFDWLWEGTLNEALGESFTIEGQHLLVYLKR